MRPRPLSVVLLAAISCSVLVVRNLRQLTVLSSSTGTHQLQYSHLGHVQMEAGRASSSSRHDDTTPAVVAYAISITNYNETLLQQSSNAHIFDRAAVLHQSIRIAHHGRSHHHRLRNLKTRDNQTVSEEEEADSTASTTPTTATLFSSSASSKYDYQMYAFVHPDAAVEVVPRLERLGYTCLVRDTPFNVSQINNPELQLAQENGCCGEREYLKLYSYTLVDHPIVVHLDLDCLVLQPMNDLFDAMLMVEKKKKKKTTTATKKKDEHMESSRTTSTSISLDAKRRLVESNGTMWTKHELDMPERIDFAYTRDYNMVDPNLDVGEGGNSKGGEYKVPTQIGVQGGFLAVRPNLDDFHSMINLILQGGDGYTIDDGWGGPAHGYGGYYGAGTIQGLASYYYGHYLNHSRSVEMNRCYYNTMVDNPEYADRHNSTRRRCRTLQSLAECQDCRDAPLSKIYTAHFTVCGKPEWCEIRFDPRYRLCMELHEQWHRIRTSIEEEWERLFPGYQSQIHDAEKSVSAEAWRNETSRERLLGNMGGHCPVEGQYVPMTFPNISSLSQSTTGISSSSSSSAIDNQEKSKSWISSGPVS